MTQDIWLIDQMAKSQYFHAKLHEWALPELADALANARGEDLDWDLSLLGIAEHAWNRVIHRGIKPILVFAHPAILSSIPRSCGYYRMLSMVSQKSMGHVKVVAGDFAEYEVGRRTLSPEQALPVARHLNEIISQLVSADATIDAHEFDLWRAMAAGTQAQGSWQNVKGRKAEAAIKGLLYLRLGERKLIAGEVGTNLSLPALIQLTDGRVVRFADDPDVGIYQGDVIVAAMEVKGGIDTAAVHERHGATLKSLVRASSVNQNCVTILILEEASLTPTAREELTSNHEVVRHWFTMGEILSSEEARERLFGLLSI